MKWRDVVREYHEQQWKAMNSPSMFSFEIFVTDVELHKDITDWLDNERQELQIRVKFHSLPCIQLTAEEKSIDEDSKDKETKGYKKNSPQRTTTSSFDACKQEEREKGFDLNKCLVKEKLEPPVPKVHKLPGEEGSGDESDFQAAPEKEGQKRKNSQSSETSSSSYSDGSQKGEESRKSLAPSLIPIPFNSGRTVIFSSTSWELMRSLLKVPLNIFVYTDAATIIGRTSIELMRFSDVIKVSLDSKQNIPCSAILDGKFDIYNRIYRVGTIDFDLRLTCLGQQTVHSINEPGNQNETEGSESVTPSESLRVLKVKVREKPYAPRIEKLLETEGVTEEFYPPFFKNATILPPMLLADDFLKLRRKNIVENKEEEAKRHRMRQSQKEWLRYRCTDIDTIVQRKTLEKLIAEGRPPFDKGSPFRRLVCPTYLKNRNINWSEADDIWNNPNIQYLQCPAYAKGVQANKPEMGPFYDPYLPSGSNPVPTQNKDFCHVKQTWHNTSKYEDIDPEEALHAVADINSKMHKWKKVLEELDLDNDCFEPPSFEQPSSSATCMTPNQKEPQMSTTNVNEQVTRIIKKLPQIICSTQQLETRAGYPFIQR